VTSFVELFTFLAEHGAEHGDGNWILDPHAGGLVFWKGITFAIVLIVLYKTAWGPILQGLDRREKTIRDAIADAERNRTESQKLLEDYRTKLESIRAEAAAIIEEGRADKKRIIEEAHAKAAHEADETKSRALREIDLAKGKALDELKQLSVKLALGIAEKVVGAEVDQNRHRKLIDETLASYDKLSRN